MPLIVLLLLRSLGPWLSLRLGLALGLLMHLRLLMHLWRRLGLPLHLLGLGRRRVMHLGLRLHPWRTRGRCARRAGLYLPLSGVRSGGIARLRGLFMLAPGARLILPGFEALPRRYSLTWWGTSRLHHF